MEWLVGSKKEMCDVVADLIPSLAPHTQATVLGLSGQLGAGKTTFVQCLAQELGVSDAVMSPTYVLIKTYNIQHETYHRLVHIDAYRLKDEKELKSIGWEEYFGDSANLICIEWPENVSGVLPEATIQFDFEVVDTDTRKITTDHF